MDGRMRLHGLSTIAISANREAPAFTSFSYHGGDHAAIGSKGPKEKTIREKTARGLASSSVVKAAPYCCRQAACRFSADAFPVLRLATTSKVTFWPSLSS